MRVLRVSHSAVVDAWRERERKLRSDGVDVVLLSARRWDEGGTAVQLEPRPGEPVIGVRTLGSHPALFVYDPRPLWHALGERWDVIDIHEEPYALATAETLLLRALRRALDRRPREPFVVYSAQNLEKRYPWPFLQLERRVLRTAAGISVCNTEAGEIARRKGLHGLVAHIPLGIDPTHFRTRTIDDEDAGAVRSPGTVNVGYSGRLAEHKGVRDLLEAVAGDERLHVDIAGDGPLREEVRARSAAFSHRVRLRGALPQEALPDFYRGLDVLAVPSLETPGWVEQFGRVAVEAMACGTPVVATSTGALPDVVGDAGLLVPPADARALRDALLRAGTDEALRARMRAAGLARARECTWPQVARQYRRLYEAVTPHRGARTIAAPTGAANQPAVPAGSEEERVVPAGREVEVVVVAYGSAELLHSALAPLVGHFPITVVDNSSSTEIRDVVERAKARYLDPGRNGGFAAGVNYALRRRQVPDGDVLLLNPDAVVGPSDVHALHRALRVDRRLASVAPEQVDGEGRPSRVAWPFPSPTGTAVEAVGLGRLRRRDDFAIGSVLLLRAEALDDVGEFDERFFLYAEETDWAYRAHRRGWRHQVVAGVRAVHLGGATSTDAARRERHFHASQERYLRKHYGSAGWQVARTAAVVGAGARTLVLAGERRASAARRLALYARGPVRAEEATQ
jgi:glycosyltransferase involved in cell wall biosynthesis/GT2 family glycosyltransferase